MLGRRGGFDLGFGRMLRRRRGGRRQFDDLGLWLGGRRGLLLGLRRRRRRFCRRLRRRDWFRRRDRLDRRLRNGRGRARGRLSFSWHGRLLSLLNDGWRRSRLLGGGAGRSLVFYQSCFMNSWGLLFLRVIHLADFGRDVIFERV